MISSTLLQESVKMPPLVQAVISQTRTSPSIASGLTPAYPSRAAGRGSDTPVEVVYLLDRDPRMFEFVSRTLSPRGIVVASFLSTAGYLRHIRTDDAGCIVLNLDLPDVHLLQLQSQIAGTTNPPLVITGHPCDLNSAVQAMKSGAIEFLTKPMDAEAMVSAVLEAFDLDRRLRRKRAELKGLQLRFSRLTPREREVFSLIAGGLLNKQAAAHLGISDITVQIHRGQVMRKMEAESFAGLVRMAVKLRIPWCLETRKPSAQRLFA